MISSRRHHDYILLLGISSSQNFTEVIKVLGIANRDQNISRTHPQRLGRGLLVSIYPELVQALWFSRSLPRNPALRIGKECKEQQAERHSANGGCVLCKQVHQGREEKHGRNQY